MLTFPLLTEPLALVRSARRKRWSLPLVALAVLLALGTLAGCEDEPPAKPKKDGVSAADSEEDALFGTDAEAPTDAEEPTDAAEPTDVQEEQDIQNDVTFLETKDGCTADCKGKVCGPDGCGKVCGFCPSGQFCAPDGKACTQFCQKKCDGKSCGDDGCGGKCGVCQDGFYCGVDDKCYENACVGSCEGKNCGDDGCGKSCGTCATGDYCDATGNCKASPCKGIAATGECDGDIYISCEGEGGSAKKIVKDCAAPPNLNNLTCDWDSTKNAYGCVKNQCANTCILDDGKKQICGPNPCGNTCGSCPAGWKCDVTVCTPQEGASCGNFPPQGQCQDGKLLTCVTGKIVGINCAEYQMVCGWVSAENKYDCKFE